MVGRLLSFCEGLFSGAMLVLGRVHVYDIHDVQIPHEYPLSLCWISDMGVVRQLDESAPTIIAKRDPCRGAVVVYNAVWLWHRFKPCRCCLTAALDVLFETLLLECCRIIVVFGLYTWLFPWQFQHQRLFRHFTKAKVKGQTALFYAAFQVRVKQMRGFAMGCDLQGCCWGVHGTVLHQWSLVLKAVWTKPSLEGCFGLLCPFSHPLPWQ